MAMKLRTGPPEEKKKLEESEESQDSQTSDETVNGVVHEPPAAEAPAGANVHQIRIAGRSFNFVILITHMNICFYATCFWIQIGALPYLSKKLGVDPVLFGYLQTTFAVVQLCGGPLYGRFGDLYGGRAAMSLAFLSAAVSYGLLGISDTVPLLFVSRLPSIFMHAMQGGQMVVTDLTESGKRAEALGQLGLSYGIGMVVGPMVGGIITKKFDEQHAAFLACVGSLLSILLCLYYVPPVTKRLETKAKEAKSGAAVFNFQKILAVAKQPEAMSLLLVKFISGIPIGVFQSMFAIVAMDTFKLAPDENGFVMSYIGVLTMITQGLGIGFLTRRTTELGIIKLGSFVLIWAYMLLSFVGAVWQLCVVLIPLCLGLTLMNVVISSALTNTVSDADTGAILGVNMAVNSLIRSVSPTVGGLMFRELGFPAFGYLGCVSSVLCTLYLLTKGPHLS